MKRLFCYLGKVAISGILAIAILSGLTLIYYNPPKARPQTDKYTNSRLEENVFWTDLIEGAGYGRTNNLGYNSAENLDSDAPFVALIGSSHTEALQIPQGKNYASQLQKRLFSDSDRDNDVVCMNFGVSGHFFNTSASNFEYFAERFPNACQAVIEAQTLEYSPEELEKMLNGDYHSDLAQGGRLKSLAQQIPYARLLFRQIQEVSKKNGTASAAPAEEDTEKDYAAYEEGMNRVLKKLSGIAKEKGITLTVLYHNQIDVEQKKAFRTDDLKTVEVFKACCEKNQVGFVDVTDRFITHFNDTYQLPYGFSNSTAGKGHLNTVGHDIIAEALYQHFAASTEEN